MWMKIKLYIVSLLFLFILIAANQIPVCFGESCGFIGFKKLLFTWPPIILFCLIGVIFSVVFYFNFRYRVVKGAGFPGETISEIESLNYENLTFLATYIIPLVCFDLDFHLSEERNFIMLLLVLILIGWIYVKTNIFYTNPTLAILNFRIYKVTTAKRKMAVVITRGKLEKGDMILPSLISDNIFYATKYESKKPPKGN
jgi:hypothetical protein